MILQCPHCLVKVAPDQKHCVTCRRLMIRRCPACAEDISVLAALCKYCGESVMPVPAAPLAPLPAVAPALKGSEAHPSGPATVAPPPAPPPDVEFIGDVRRVAWEDRSAGGRMKRWWTTWAALMNPSEFWRRAPVEGGHCKPISFAWFPVAQLLTLFGLPLVFAGTALAGSASVPEKAIMFGGAWLLLYPLTYVMVALTTWVTAAVWHIPLKILGGKGTYEGTVRTVAYNSGANLWHLVPVLGSVVALILGTFLNYHAFRNVHSLGKYRAAFAAALPWIAAAAAVAAVVALGQCDFLNIESRCRIRC